MNAAAIAAACGDARRERRGWHCRSRFGVRECELNAVVVAPEIGRRLVRDAILRFVPADAPARYQVRLAVERGQLRDAIQRLTVSP